MANKGKELEKGLLPLKRKMILWGVLRLGLWSLAGYVLFVTLLQFASLLIFVDNTPIVVLAVAAIPIVAVIGGLLFAPSLERLAKQGDSFGMQERLITALELIGKNKSDHPAVDDTLRVLSGADLASAYSPPSLRRPIASIGLAGVLLGIVMIMPPIRAEAIETQRRLSEVLATEAEAILEAAEAAMELADTSTASEIEEVTHGVLRELAQAQNEAQVLRTIQEAQARLQSIAYDSINQDMRELGRMLQEHHQFQELGASLEGGDFAGIEQELNALTSFLESADEQTRAEAAEVLAETARELAQDISDSGELAQLLDDLSQSLAQGSLGEASASLSRELQRLASENADLRRALQDLQRALNNQNNNQDSNQNNNQDNQGPPNDGTDNPQNTGEGQMLGGSGNGIAVSDGLAEDPSAGGSGGSGQGEGTSGRGFGHIEGTNIYTRGAQYLGDFEAHLEGPQDATGDAHTQEVQGLSSIGEVRPLNEVLADFTESQLQQLDTLQIPPSMRQLIQDYFSSLQ